MKLAWPSHRLNRWSRRLIQRISFALAACFLAITLTVPASAVVPSSATLAPNLGTGDDLETLVSQGVNFERNILTFNTPNYAVRVFTPAGTLTPVMNVFKRSAPTQLELNAQPASFRGAITSDGFLTYESFGSRYNRNVVFLASHNRGTRQARLEIVDQANGQVILTEFANGVDAPQMPEAGVTGALERNTLLGFETQNYAVRVFRDPADNLRKLNVYHKATSTTLVNGQVATPETSGTIPSYECWISYYGGSSFNGAAARYYVRVNAGGRAVLDILSPTGATLLSEPRTNAVPLTVNVPMEDRPACFEGGGVPSNNLAPFVAAVFGGQPELERVRQVLTPSLTSPRRLDSCDVTPRLESAPQGQFINAAECTNRNEAAAIVEFLRGQSFNSRLIYRNFRYR